MWCTSPEENMSIGKQTDYQGSVLHQKRWKGGGGMRGGGGGGVIDLLRTESKGYNLISALPSLHSGSERPD